MKAVVLVDPASSGANLKKAAKTQGFKVIGIFTQSKESYELIYKTEHEEAFTDCDEVIRSSDKDTCLEKLKASPFEIEGVIAGSEVGVELADQLAYALDLWRNPIELSRARRHKGDMREHLKKTGLACPDFKLCYSEEDIAEFVATHPHELIVKTPKGVMTSQVYQCDTLKKALDAFHKIHKVKDIFGEIPTCAVIEDYIGGREYIIDTFSDGETVHVTDIWYYDFIDTEEFKNIYYNVISVPLDDPLMKPITHYAIEAAKRFGIERGFAHIEIKDDPKRGPVLIELGARLPGMRVPNFLKKHSNFDPYTGTIKAFTQERTSVPEPIIFTKHCAIAFCPLFKGGTVKSIHGIEQIKELKSYEDHILHLHPGDAIEASTHGCTIPLIVFLAHPDRKELLKDVEAAHKLFALKYSG